MTKRRRTEEKSTFIIMGMIISQMSTAIATLIATESFRWRRDCFCHYRHLSNTLVCSTRV
jgi:hypothetical protein